MVEKHGDCACARTPLEPEIETHVENAPLST